MSNNPNEARADRALRALEQHAGCSLTDNETMQEELAELLADLVADLTHLCDRYDLDLSAVLYEAQRTYACDLDEDGLPVRYLFKEEEDA